MLLHEVVVVVAVVDGYIINILVKSHLSFQCTLNQLETAVEDPTHRMYQLEVSVFSSLLKMLCTN